MKKSILILTICFGLAFPVRDAYAIDPKAKAFLVVVGYGTVGGALLGFASLAFNPNSRAVAQGASLGLYAGIIFGAYVLTSYRPGGVNQPSIDTYPDPYMQYPPTQYPPAGGYGVPPREEEGGFFSPRRVDEIRSGWEMEKGANMPPVYLNLLNATF